jgi:tetratricopeptide (TPR) repeat protein/predicted Ser/Thr protein kinase
MNGDDPPRSEIGSNADPDQTQTLFRASTSVVQGSPLPVKIGAYRIIRLLGEGGMGRVYLAEQERPRREVALKVIKPGYATPEMLRRFEQESQVLGRLHHPGIAQIYEASTADEGLGDQPFFAMEFVSGRPLPDYLRGHGIKTRGRVELMVKVCEAVHHAHRRGIIHRDLKPNNILVDHAGQPKILDFGVARITDSDAHATRQTSVGELIGTLAYMSPEQVLADPLELDTRSDVYALGVILYELLTGRLPYAAERRQVHEIVLAIRAEEPSPLSSIDRSLRGDLDTIVGKALEKDKTRRYSSAAELGADLNRFLTDEPIVARPPSAVYQLQKFARRHKPVVLGIVAVFIVLAAGAIASTLLAIRASREQKLAIAGKLQADQARALAEQREKEAEAARRLAEKNRAEAERQTIAAETARRNESLQTRVAEAQALEARRQGERAENNFTMARDAVDRYLTKVSDSPELTARGLEGLRRQLLGTARDFYQQFVTAHASDPRVQLDLGQALFRLANLDVVIGENAEAEQSLLKAIAVFESLHKADPAAAKPVEDIVGALNSLGLLYDMTNRIEKADETFARGAKLQEEWDRTHTPSAAGRLIFGNIYDNWANAYGRRDPALSLKYHLKAFELREQAAASDPANEEFQTSFLKSNVNLVFYYGTARQPAKALPYAEAGVRIAERLSSAHPGDADRQYQVSGALNNLAGVYALLGRLSDSRDAHRRARDLREPLYREHPTVVEYAIALAGSYVNLAELEERFENPSGSLDLAAKSIDILKSVLEREPRQAVARFSLRYAYLWRARDLSDLGRYADAVTAWDSAITYDDFKDTGLRAGRILAIAQLGRCGDAAKDSAEVLAAQKISGDAYYDLARAKSVCATSDSDVLQVMDLLKNAAAAGFFGDAANLRQLSKDATLVRVRSIAPFREWFEVLNRDSVQ